MHSGSSLVQGSFAVNGGNMPATELVLGVAAVLPRGSEIVFSTAWAIATFLPGSTTVAKRIRIADLAQFRYDPIKIIST